MSSGDNFNGRGVLVSGFNQPGIGYTIATIRASARVVGPREVSLYDAGADMTVNPRAAYGHGASRRHCLCGAHHGRGPVPARVRKMFARRDAMDSDWPLHGRTSDEQRFSPLTAIDSRNVEPARSRLVIRAGDGSRSGGDAAPSSTACSTRRRRGAS